MSATALDVVYAQIQRHSDAIVSEERQRLLRVEHNCLADDTTVLAHQLSRQTHHNNALKRWLHQAEKAYSQILQENENRNLAAEATSREMRACQVELQSLRTASKDATRVLADKLALSRELFAVKVENDHLRANTINYETLQAEKLSLQRELNSVRVELETEKRALQRALSRDEARVASEERSRASLEVLEAELEKERISRQRQEMEARMYREESDAQRNLLESKIESLRDKLKMARVQMKNAQQAPMSIGSKLLQPAEVLISENARKRKRPETDGSTLFEDTEYTRASKETTRTSTFPGDKSLFSMTPFLNKTGLGDFQHLSPTTRADAEGDALKMNISASSSPAIRTFATSKSKSSVDITGDNGIEPRRGVQRLGRKVTSGLDQVVEENLDSESAAAGKGHKEQESKEVDVRSRLQPAPPLKKRRALGKSHTNIGLEGDEHNPTKAGDVTEPRFEALRCTSRGINKGRQGTLQMMPFSPLKRDRKF